MTMGMHFAALAFLVLAPGAYAATTSINVYAFDRVDNIEIDADDPPAVVGGAGSVSDAAATMLSSAYGTAQLGSLRLFALGTGTYHGSDAHFSFDHAVVGQAEASGAWSDDITVTAPGLAGTSGQIVGALRVGGALSVFTNAVSSFNGQALQSANWGLSVDPSVDFGSENSVGGSVSQSSAYDSESMTDYIEAATSGDTGFPIDYQVRIPFTFGVPVSLEIAGSALAFGDGRGLPIGVRCGGTSDLGSTLAWSGVVDVVDGEGTSVVGYTVNSTGGWMTLPEPGTGLASLVAIACLGVVSVRRRNLHRDSVSHRVA